VTDPAGSAGSSGRASTGRLPADAFDSHCHLDLIERPVAGIVADARAAGITRMITVGCDLPSSRWAANCAAEHADVYAAVAIHPNETAAAAAGAGGADAVLAGIAALAALPQVRRRRDRARLLPGSRRAVGPAGLVPRAYRDRQDGRQGADDSRP